MRIYYTALAVILILSPVLVNGQADKQEILRRAIVEQTAIGLLEAKVNGADFNAPINNIGTLPLGLAVAQNSTITVSDLLNFGADPNKKSKLPLLIPNELRNKLKSILLEEFSLLHLAILNGNLEIVKLLIDYGAELDTISNGRTVLEFAIEQDEKLIALYLKPREIIEWNFVANNEDDISFGGFYYLESIDKIQTYGFSRYARLVLHCGYSGSLEIAIDFSGIVFSERDANFEYQVNGEKGMIDNWNVYAADSEFVIYDMDRVRSFLKEISTGTDLLVKAKSAFPDEIISVKFAIPDIRPVAEKYSNACNILQPE